jgi:hypothetical protein
MSQVYRKLELKTVIVGLCVNTSFPCRNERRIGGTLGAKKRWQPRTALLASYNSAWIITTNEEPILNSLVLTRRPQIRT